MKEPSLLWFLVGVALVSFSAAMLVLFVDAGEREYGLTIDNTSISAYDKMDEVQATTEDIKNDLTNINPYNPLDILGAFFSNGYRILIKLPAQSLAITTAWINSAADNLNLGEAGSLMVTTAIVILTILFFVGIVLFVLLKVRA